MALSVKAYLNPATNQQEIRRFAIDEGASANFAYLRQKIEQVFPSVRGKVFKLFWKGKIIGFLLIRFARSISCEKCRVLCVLYQYKFHLKAVLLNRDRYKVWKNKLHKDFNQQTKGKKGDANFFITVFYSNVLLCN